MAISSRFTIAVHILVYLAKYSQLEKVTSDVLAKSIQVNPVIIRGVLSQLKKAGIIDVKRGQGGASILKADGDISLYDLYEAVESLKHQPLFSFHERPNPKCSVGRQIHDILDDQLLAAQLAMENQLKQTSLADLLAKTD